ncbi:MAG TPA: cytochrome c-type biogenesis protein CcmH [Candidatus Limnocylindria bacterium]|nr:cytochrome c-type biogenesis protein CcmH [Candidatus Limnocylindria bacterium]
MRRLAVPVAGAALLALGALLAVTLLRPQVAPTRAEAATQLAGQLRCPDCAGLSVAESSSASASAIRTEIGRLLDQGATPDEVRQHFVDRYGQWILLAPPAPIAWALPLLVLLAAGFALGGWLMLARRPAAQAAVTGGLAEDPRLEQVRREAESLDA